MKFKLLAGSHVEQTGVDPAGLPILRRFSQGDVVESPYDLVARFEHHDHTFPAKFERLPDNYVEPPKEEVYSSAALTPEEIAAWRAQQRQSKQPTTAQQAPPAPPPGATATTTAPPALTVSPAQARTLEGMTAEELVKWAAAEEIDLKGARHKDAILKVLRQHGILK